MPKFKVRATIIDTCVRTIEADDEADALAQASLGMTAEEWREWSNNGAYVDDVEVVNS